MPIAADIRIGALLIPARGWERLVAEAQTVEALGLDSLWIDDHLANPAGTQQPWLEAWTTLTALATATSHIRIGTMMTNSSIRPAALLAQQALTVDALSGGRLNLGMGSGYAPTDHALLGQAVPAVQRRIADFRQRVEQIDRLLRGMPHSPEADLPPGVDAVRIREEGSGRSIPLTIAAHGPGSLSIAARYGDSWNSFGGWNLTPAEHLNKTRERVLQLREFSAEAGRTPDAVRCSLLAGNPMVTPAPLWSSFDAFADFVGRYSEIGIREFVFYYPPESLYGRRTVAPGTFERFINDLLSGNDRDNNDNAAANAEGARQ